MDKPQQNLAIRLDCQVASIELDIAEVNGLLNGDMITLQKTLLPVVDLMYHGRIIANGQLINLDGHLGMKINHVFTEIGN